MSIFPQRPDLPNLGDQPPETTLGRLVEGICGASTVHSIDRVIRALTNWYRLQFLFSKGLMDKFISWDQRHSYQLLFDWWTAAFNDATFPSACLRIFLQSSEILAGEMNSNSANSHPELWTCIKKNLDVLGSNSPIPDSPNDMPSYDRSLWELFMFEFANPETYETEISDLITSVRRDAAIEAYCHQAAVRCLKTPTQPTRLSDPGEGQAPLDFICSIEASDRKYPRLLTRGPLLRACPWLDREDAQQSVQPFDKDDGLEGWPRYLWDVKNCRSIDVCGLDTRPEYTTISHTWGRWELRSREGYRLPGGLKYRIPYNDKFDVTEIPNCLKALGAEIHTDHIWLDLLCIPQGIQEDEKRRDGGGNDDHRDILDPEDVKIKANEIARQGSIFRNATTSIAWLHDFEDLSCLKWLFCWFSLSTLTPSNNVDEEKNRVVKYIKNNKNPSTGLLANVTEADKGDQPAWLKGSALAGDYKPPRAGSSWFTSLWTLQEVCLRPDMWLAICKSGKTSDSKPPSWDLLSTEDGSPIPFNGFVCLFRKVRKIINNSKHQAPMDALFHELFEWSSSTGLDGLLELSRIDIIRLGDRRYCRERRAEAIMSAIGATRWFDEVREGSYDPEADQVLDKYPRNFIQEVRNQIPGEFFAAYCKWPHSDVEDAYRMQGGLFGERDGKSLMESYTKAWACGSLLPFSKTGYQYYRLADKAPFRVRYVTHESVKSWTILSTGRVGIKKACVISSRISKPKLSGHSPLMCHFLGFFRGGLEHEPTNPGLEYLDEPVDLHKWTSSRQFEVYAVAVMSQKFKSNDTIEGQPPKICHAIRGVVFRGQEIETTNTASQELVKIGIFYTLSDSFLNLPDVMEVNWTIL